MKSRQSGYMRTYPVVVAVAVSAALLGVAFAATAILGAPLLHTTSLGLAVRHPVDDLWAASLGVGGVLVLAGMLRLTARLEASGLALLAGCYAVDAFAVIHARGVVDALIAASTFAALAIGCSVRVYLLTAASRRDEGDG